MIDVRSISYRYPGEAGLTVLRGVSLTLRRGEYVALMGANGSGKTTLARSLNGLIHPCEGCVSVDGMSASDETELYEIRRRVGMVFQNPDTQIVATTVEREIAFGLENLGVDHPEMVRRIDAALARFDLSEYRQASPHLLSGGERQRLALASVWVMHPHYYVLDEPTSLLDPHARREILGFLQRERQAGDRGILLITQFAEEALGCDRLAVMDAGAIVLDGPPPDVFRRIPALHALGLDVPVGIELEDYLKEHGIASFV
ncbi:MAG TPA: ATP-binding cassette domain-containing protein [bacterium]|nr:ATP-binding cassette domain-containing protein [bacterium]